MSVEELNSVRAALARHFEAINDTWLPAAVRAALLAYGGTLIGPDAADGPAEYQLELLGVTGFGESPAAAARQWNCNVIRICNPELAWKESE